MRALCVLILQQQQQQQLLHLQQQLLDHQLKLVNLARSQLCPLFSRRRRLRPGKSAEICVMETMTVSSSSGRTTSLSEEDFVCC